MFSNESPPMMPPPEPTVYTSKNLSGQDSNLELLQSYFKELQSMTVETSMDSEIDMLTFAISAHYFGVVMMKEPPVPKSATEEADTRGGWDGCWPLEAAPSPEGPAPPAPIPLESFEETYNSMSEEERFDRWKFAFRKKLSRHKDLDSDSDDDLADIVRKRKARAAKKGLVGANQEDEVGSPDKGKQRQEIEPHENIPARSSQFVSNSRPEDMINWPEETSDFNGPPSTADDAMSSYADAESDVGGPISPFSDNFSWGSIAPQPVDDDNFGREFLEPEAGPAQFEPEIPQDPAIKAMIVEAALKLQEQLRAKTVREFEEKQARKAARAMKQQRFATIHPDSVMPTPTFPIAPPPPPPPKPIGILYLTSSQNFTDPLHAGECNLGVYIAPEYRNLRQVADAMHSVIEDAFRNPDCHRLQVILVDHKDKLDYLNLFTSCGFRHEGTRRRAYFSPIACEWKDVTYLAILATEWVYDRTTRSTAARLLPTSLWDEVLSRHQREQEEILKMEETKFGYGGAGMLKRTTSTETIKDRVPMAMSVDSGAESGFTTDASSSSAHGSSKQKKLASQLSDQMQKRLAGRRPSYSSSESGFDSDWDFDMFESPSHGRLGVAGGGENEAGPSDLRSASSLSVSSSSSSWMFLED